MKTQLISIIFLSSTLYCAEANMAWVDQKIEEIKPQRKGVSSGFIASLKNPFIIVKPESKGKGKGGASASTSKKVSSDSKKVALKKDMSKEPLTLQIVLNSSALINGKWYKENATVRGYKLTEIQSNSVVLQDKKKKIKLFIAQKNNKLKISTK